MFPKRSSKLVYSAKLPATFYIIFTNRKKNVCCLFLIALLNQYNNVSVYIEN